MRRRTRNRKLMAEINITPFTDVMLVLLIVFVVAAPIIFKDDIKVSLPQSGAAKKSEASPKSVTVTINAEDDVFIDKMKFNLHRDMDKLQAQISSMTQNTKDVSVTINGDKTCKYDSVIQIINAFNQAGVKKILLGVELKR